MSKTKILFIIPGQEGDGKNMIFAKRQIESLSSRVFDKKICHLEYRGFGLPIIKEIFKLRKQVHEFNPHIIHAQYGTITAFVSLLISFNKKFVLSVRGNDLNPDFSLTPSRRILGRLLTQISALFADAVFCVSKQLKQNLWPLSKQKAFIFPSGVDFDHFKPLDPVECFKDINLPQDHKTVLFYAGNDDHVKRRDIAEKIVAEAKNLYGNFNFFVIKRNVDPSEMPKFLNAASCLLLTSDNEGSPNIIKEASACNLPIVTAKVGDVAEILKHDQKSYVSKNRDIKEMAKALAYILEKNERSDNRGNLQYLSINSISERLQTTYLNV